MSTKVWEFRIRFKGDNRSWEDIAVAESSYFLYPQEFAVHLIDTMNKIEEVRYNVVGNGQGHYES